MPPSNLERSLTVGNQRRPLVIERPDLQTRAQRYGYLSVTFLCWFLWLYLFVPLMSFAAWAVGATLVYQVMLQNLDVADLVDMLRGYGTGIAALTTIYLLWAVSSYLRFRRVDRRTRPPDASDAELAASHRLRVIELHRMRSARRMVLSAELLDRMFGAGAVPTEPEAGREKRPKAAQARG